MAKDTETKTTAEVDGKKVTFKAVMPEAVDMSEGKSYTGIFVMFKEAITIDDQNTGQKKNIRGYIFRDVKTGKKFSILGRTMLDMAFDDIFEAYDGPTNVLGRRLTVRRLDNSKLKRGRTLGNFEIDVYETEAE